MNVHVFVCSVYLHAGEGCDVHGTCLCDKYVCVNVRVLCAVCAVWG